jgi:ATP-dependent DNA ligase
LASIGSIGGSTGKSTVSILVHRRLSDADLDRSALAKLIAGQNEPVDLPVMPPVSPMLAKSVASIPPGASYEPKWDGFRSICFRDGDESNWAAATSGR